MFYEKKRKIKGKIKGKKREKKRHFLRHSSHKKCVSQNIKNIQIKMLCFSENVLLHIFSSVTFSLLYQRIYNEITHILLYKNTELINKNKYI